MAGDTSNIGLKRPDTGQFPGTWGPVANENADVLDALFSATAPTGHSHTGVAGEGPQISHLVLGDKGVQTHATLDTHITDASLGSSSTYHYPKTDVQVRVNNKNSTGSTGTAGYFPITEIRFPNAISVTSPSSGIVVVETATQTVLPPPTGGGSGNPNTAPVVVSENFTGSDGYTLHGYNWFTTSSTAASSDVVTNNFQLRSTVVTGAVSGQVSARIRTQVPHSYVQRASLHIDDLNVIDMIGDANVTYAVALMSTNQPSNFVSSTNSPRNPGVYLEISVKRSNTSLLMDRRIVVYQATGIKVIWADTTRTITQSLSENVLSDYSYVGAHELSIQRADSAGVCKVAYYHNNGPVDITVGAITSNLLLTDLEGLAAHLAEFYTIVPGSNYALTDVTAPRYGRFGFDVEWSSVTTLYPAIRHFSASSVDDENGVSYKVRPNYAQQPFAPVTPPPPPPPPPETCCPPGTAYPTVTVGSPFPPVAPPDVPTPLEGRPYTVESIDATTPDRKFTISPAGGTPKYTVYCGNIRETATTSPSTQVAPGTTGKTITVIGDSTNTLDPRISEPVTVDIFPSSSAGGWVTGRQPPGAGGNPRAFIDSPQAGAPAGVSGGSSAIPTSQSLLGTVVKNLKHTRKENGTLDITFDVPEGVPPCGAFDIVLTETQRSTNTKTIVQAVSVVPPIPEWSGSVKYYAEGIIPGTLVPVPTGTAFKAGATYYVVASGSNLPLPTGYFTYPFTSAAAGLAGAYRAVDGTGAVLDSSIASIDFVKVYRGNIVQQYTNTSMADWPGSSAANDFMSVGETVFAKITLGLGAYNKVIKFQARQVLNPALPTANLDLGTIAAETIYIAGLTSASDFEASASLKTVTLTGRNFSTLAGNLATIALLDTTANPDVVITSSVTSRSGTNIVFTCTTPASTATHTIQLTVTNPLSGATATTSWVVGSVVMGGITSINVMDSGGVPGAAVPVVGGQYQIVENIGPYGLTVSVASGLTDPSKVVLTSGSGTNLGIIPVEYMTTVITNPATGAGYVRFGIGASLASVTPLVFDYNTPLFGTYQLTVENSYANQATAPVTLAIVAHPALTISSIAFNVDITSLSPLTFSAGDVAPYQDTIVRRALITGTNFRDNGDLIITRGALSIPFTISPFADAAANPPAILIDSTKILFQYAYTPAFPVFLGGESVTYTVRDRDDTNTASTAVTTRYPVHRVFGYDGDFRQGAGSTNALPAITNPVDIGGGNLDNTQPGFAISVADWVPPDGYTGATPTVSAGTVSLNSESTAYNISNFVVPAGSAGGSFRFKIATTDHPNNPEMYTQVITITEHAIPVVSLSSPITVPFPNVSTVFKFTGQNLRHTAAWLTLGTSTSAFVSQTVTKRSMTELWITATIPSGTASGTEIVLRLNLPGVSNSTSTSVTGDYIYRIGVVPSVPVDPPAITSAVYIDLTPGTTTGAVRIEGTDLSPTTINGGLLVPTAPTTVAPVLMPEVAVGPVTVTGPTTCMWYPITVSPYAYYATHTGEPVTYTIATTQNASAVDTLPVTTVIYPPVNRVKVATEDTVNGYPVVVPTAATAVNLSYQIVTTSVQPVRIKKIVRTTSGTIDQTRSSEIASNNTSVTAPVFTVVLPNAGETVDIYVLQRDANNVDQVLGTQVIPVA